MLVLTLLVRDEGDIIEANLEHHFAMGVDFAIVTDHRSVDKTPDILARYAESGRIRLFRELQEPYYQARWVTGMARLAHSLGATWVINADADEFWWPGKGHDDLAAVLESQPPEVDAVVAWRSDFAPLPERAGHFWEHQVYREVNSHNILGQPLPPKVAHRARPDIEIAQGNHSVSAPHLGAIVDDASLEILHFPLRTYEQFERKIVNGGHAYEASDLPLGVGHTWRVAYQMWQDGELRSLYDKHVLGPERLAAKLLSGEVVEDRRLTDALRPLGSGVKEGPKSRIGAS